MKRNKLLYFLMVFILLLTSNSCHLIGRGNGIDFEIKNNSELPITNVKFYTTEKLKIVEFDKIEPNERVSDFLSMTYNKSDGAYVLEYTRSDGKKENYRDGYYTNGGALDRWVKFNIESDTALVKFSGW